MIFQRDVHHIFAIQGKQALYCSTKAAHVHFRLHRGKRSKSTLHTSVKKFYRESKILCDAMWELRNVHLSSRPIHNKIDA